MIARIRQYSSLKEARQELGRLALSVSLREADIHSKLFTFIEGTPSELIKLAEDVRGLGESSVIVALSRGRMLIVGDWRLIEELGSPAGNERILLSARNYISPLEPGFRWGPFHFERTAVMGILNVTPDSFSDGGLYLDENDALNRAHQMVDEGADVIDVGGESTRPYSEGTDERVEMERIIPVIGEICQTTEVPVSVDTRKPSVAMAAVDAGASIINDISGLRDPGMIEVARELQVPVVIMHMRGEPRTMQMDVEYEDVIGDILRFLWERVEAAERSGVDRSNIMIDPGIGFGKTFSNNLEILRRLREMRCMGLPILVGSSRKAFIGRILGENRLEGSLAAAATSVMNGANMVRVHDVAQSVRVCRMIDGIIRSNGQS